MAAKRRKGAQNGLRPRERGSAFLTEAATGRCKHLRSIS